MKVSEKLFMNAVLLLVNQFVDYQDGFVFMSVNFM
jgi:hypothetical protein